MSNIQIIEQFNTQVTYNALALRLPTEALAKEASRVGGFECLPADLSTEPIGEGGSVSHRLVLRLNEELSIFNIRTAQRPSPRTDEVLIQMN